MSDQSDLSPNDREALEILRNAKGWVDPSWIGKRLENLAPNRKIDDPEKYRDMLKQLEERNLVEENPNTKRIPERCEYDVTEKGKRILEAEGEPEEAEKGPDKIKEKYESADNVVDEARLLSGSLEAFTKSELAAEVGVTVETIEQKLRILELDERVIKFLERGKITSYLKALDCFKGRSERFIDGVCDRVEEKDSTVDGPELEEIEDRVSKELGEPERGTATRKSWSEKDEEFLRGNYGEMPIEKISEELDRSKDAIRHKASNLGVKAGEYWKDEEIEFLKEHLEEMTDEEMGEELGRSRAAVQNKRHDLDLIKPQEKFTDEEFMNLYEKGLSDGTIAEKLGVSRSAVSGRRRELGLESNARQITVGELNERIKKLEERVEKERELGSAESLGKLRERIGKLEKRAGERKLKERIKNVEEKLESHKERTETQLNQFRSKLNEGSGKREMEFYGELGEIFEFLKKTGICRSGDDDNVLVFEVGESLETEIDRELMKSIGIKTISVDSRGKGKSGKSIMLRLEEKQNQSEEQED